MALYWLFRIAFPRWTRPRRLRIFLLMEWFDSVVSLDCNLFLPEDIWVEEILFVLLDDTSLKCKKMLVKFAQV